MIDLETFLISDYHFGHKKLYNEYEPIRKQFEPTSFLNFENRLIEIWNSTITDNDSILIVGDLLINKKDQLKTLDNIEKISKILNGKKFLIKGNHDTLPNEIYIELGWNLLGLEQREFPFIIYNNIIISHYPIWIRPKSEYPDPYLNKKLSVLNFMKKNKIKYNIHGHMHSREVSNNKFFNVSCEKLNFNPIKFKNIIKTCKW